jgi:isochorismate hydrolase
MKSEAVHGEVPIKEAAVKTITALKKWYRDWHLEVMHHSQPKERTQGNYGFRKKLATACRGMTHHAGVAV